MTTNTSLSRAYQPRRATAVASETHAHQPSSFACTVLIYGAAIRNAPKALKIQLDDHLRSTVKGYEGRYEAKRPTADVGSLACPLWRATSHSTRATAVLINGAAIRNPHKALKIQLDDYLKSTVKGERQM
jgi:hypothetical protein